MPGVRNLHATSSWTRLGGSVQETIGQMDLGVPLIDYGPVDARALRDTMLAQPPEFWEMDSASRTKVAGTRPGNAVFLYNPMPPMVRRMILAEAQSGHVSVLRYRDRPLFREVQDLIDRFVQPLFPDCDPIWAQLAELPPGGEIAPHSDRHILAAVHRLHVPLITHDEVEFLVGGETFHLKPDILYDLNNVVTHSVTNRSGIMRIHLLVDMMPHSLARTRYFDDEQEMAAAVSACALPPGLPIQPGHYQ